MAIINLENTKKTAIIEIPDFDGVGIIEIEVQRPNFMRLIKNGEVPNHLLSLAQERLADGFGESLKKASTKEKAEYVAKYYELILRVCLVNPSYEEFEPYITDDQAEAVVTWSMTSSEALRSFRNQKKNNADYRNGKTLPKTTERNHKG